MRTGILRLFEAGVFTAIGGVCGGIGAAAAFLAAPYIAYINDQRAHCDAVRNIESAIIAMYDNPLGFKKAGTFDSKVDTYLVELRMHADAIRFSGSSGSSVGEVEKLLLLGPNDLNNLSGQKDVNKISARDAQLKEIGIACKKQYMGVESLYKHLKNEW